MSTEIRHLEKAKELCWEAWAHCTQPSPSSAGDGLAAMFSPLAILSSQWDAGASPRSLVTGLSQLCCSETPPCSVSLWAQPPCWPQCLFICQETQEQGVSIKLCSWHASFEKEARPREIYGVRVMGLFHPMPWAPRKRCQTSSQILWLCSSLLMFKLQNKLSHANSQPAETPVQKEDFELLIQSLRDHFFIVFCFVKFLLG